MGGSAGGSTNPFDAGGETVFIDSGGVDVPRQQLCRRAARASRQPVPQGDVRLQRRRDDLHGADRHCRRMEPSAAIEHGLPQRDLRRVHRGHGVRRDRQSRAASAASSARRARPSARRRTTSRTAPRCGTGMVCQARELRDLPGGLPVPADEPVSQRDAGLLGRGADLHGREHQRRRRAPSAARTWCATRRRLRGVRRRHDLHRVRASPAAGARSPATPARRSASKSGNQPNGTPCGSDMVCSNGNCAACSVGTLCQPANPCHSGVTVCAPSIGCTDTGNSLANGASCGTDRVCNAGTCVSCAAGASCQPTNPCKTGATSCATGSPVCVESGNRASGTMCGANMVCNATGTCVGVHGGGACTPTGNPCHTGTLTCSTGAPVCTDTRHRTRPTARPAARTWCAGPASCVACVANQACQPTNPCKNGATSCATGRRCAWRRPTRAPGTLCGAGQSCANGVLTLPAMCNANGACAAATMPCPSRHLQHRRHRLRDLPGRSDQLPHRLQGSRRAT